MTCPGSVQLSKGMVREDSIYALEGTKAHSVAELALKNGTDAIADDEETRRSVQVYLDEIRSVEVSHEVIIRHTERTLEHATIKGFGGTADHYVGYLEDDKIVLHTFDYKHGAGVPVEVIENPQLLSYFSIIGSYLSGLIDIYRGTIVQPRCFAGDEVQTWECNADRVARHEEEVKQAMISNHLFAGDHCKWCPAVMICPTLEQAAKDTAKLDFEVIRDDAEKLAELMRLSPAITTLLKKVPVAVMERIKSGAPMPGYKVVAKRLSNRQWAYGVSETVDALTTLGLRREEIIVEDIKTPTQIEKALLDKEAKKTLQQYVVRRPTGFKVVPEDAKGEPANLSDVNVTEFERYEEDDD